MKTKFKVKFPDLEEVVREAQKSQEHNVLVNKIHEYLEIKGIGQAIVDGVEFIMRLRLGQFNIAFGQVQKYFKELNKENFNNVKEDLHNIIDYIGKHGISSKWRGDRVLYDLLWKAEVKCNGRPIAKYIDIEEVLYKALELGEYLKCYEKYGGCIDVKSCWITRKGFCERREKR